MVHGIGVIVPSQSKLEWFIAEKYLWLIRVGGKKIEHEEEMVGNGYLG